MNVVILTEGNQKIGFGHLTRSLSLYQAFEARGLEPILIINGEGSFGNLLQHQNYQIFNWLEHSIKLFSILNDDDIVVIDSYLANDKIYQNISNTVSLVIYLDDNKRLEYPKGIVVNGSIYANDLSYPVNDGVNYLLGSEFVPLRKEFWNLPPKRIFGDIQKIMVTFGGDDLRNMTPKVLELLVNRYPQLIKKIVIGKWFKNIGDIESLKDYNTELIYYPDAIEMKKTMIESDLVISASGQTLYELARVGTPTIAIAVASNQFNNVKNWQKNGFIEYAGLWDNISLFDNLIISFNRLDDMDLRIKKSELGMVAVDGQGALRIVKYALKQYYENKKITLRKAKIDDLMNIYLLSNDEEVRKYSFNDRKIDLEEHKNWFKMFFDKKNNLFLILENCSDFMGQVRFKIEDKEAILSISLVKKYRGLGFGKIALNNSLKILEDEYPSIELVKAEIKENNRSSIKLFEKSNFTFLKKTIINNHSVMQYSFPLGGE